MQTLSNKIEKRLNAGNSIVRGAIADYNELAAICSLSQADRDEITAAGMAVKDALDAYCLTLRAKAPTAGITPQSGGQDKV